MRSASPNPWLGRMDPHAPPAAGGPGDDPVLSLLDAASGAYRAHEQALRGELAMARGDAAQAREQASHWRAEAEAARAEAGQAQRETHESRGELEALRRAFDRQHE